MIGLRGRLATAFVAAAVLASAITGGIAYWLVRLAVLDRVQVAVVNDVRRTTGQVVSTRLADGTSGPDVLRSISDALVRPGWQSWAVNQMGEEWVTSGAKYGWIRISPSLIGAVRGESRLKAAGGSPSARRIPTQRAVFQRIVSRGVPYLVVGTPVQLRGANGGRTSSSIEAYVIVSLRREAADLDRLATSAAIGGAVAVAVAVLLALLAARSVLRPVRRLAAAAKGLGAGELDRRVTVRGRDELAGLARIFNDTAAALQNSVTELREMERSARRFVADVSHELRTPLTAMTAVTDALEEEATGTGATAARVVAEETRRLSTLVGHLLEISRIDAGAAELVLDDVDPARLVLDGLRLRGWAGAVRTDLEADLRARLDPRRFDVIVANLVGNAVEHGEPPITVRLRGSREAGGPGIRLRVTDGGPGIPEDVRGHVFERFYKADTARARSDGSGLGLAIARANAELHGGSLDLLATGTGTAFELWLPGRTEEAE